MAFMQWARRMALVLVGCAGLWGAAQAQDMAGAKDHPAVKRFGGSSIVGYEVRNFDAVEFQTSTFKEFDLVESDTNHNHEDIVENIEIYRCVAIKSMR